MKILCECSSFDCTKLIDLPTREALKAKLISAGVIIIDGCHMGPDSTDVLVEKKVGYSIYKEVKQINSCN